MNELPVEKFEMWARVDLMGHNVRAGKLSVVNTGVEMLYRLDIPTPDGFVTKFFGSGSVYSIDPVSESAARLIAQRLGTAEPISQWDLPEQWKEAMRAAQAKALPSALPSPDADPGPDDNTEYDDEDDDSEDE